MCSPTTRLVRTTCSARGPLALSLDPKIPCLSHHDLGGHPLLQGALHLSTWLGQVWGGISFH